MFMTYPCLVRKNQAHDQKNKPLYHGLKPNNHIPQLANHYIVQASQQDQFPPAQRHGRMGA